jgi:hypothetical protein
MAQLRSLSLHLLPSANGLAPPPPVERAVLPVLTRLNFRGTTWHLDALAARIDAPFLEGIEVSFSNKFAFELLNFGEFIDRIQVHKTHTRVDILSSDPAFSISLTQPGTPKSLKLRLFHESLSMQLSCITRISTYFSPFLSNVEDLRICATRASIWTSGLYPEQWAEVINSFAGVKRFHVAGNLSTDIVHALQLPDRRHDPVLPTLHGFYVSQPEPCRGSLREAVASFMASRRLSGHPVAVEYEPLYHISEQCETGKVYAKQHYRSRLRVWNRSIFTPGHD